MEVLSYESKDELVSCNLERDEKEEVDLTMPAKSHSSQPACKTAVSASEDDGKTSAFARDVAPLAVARKASSNASDTGGESVAAMESSNL